MSANAWDCLVWCSIRFSKLKRIFNQQTRKNEHRYDYITLSILHGRTSNYANEYISCKCVAPMFTKKKNMPSINLRLLECLTTKKWPSRMQSVRPCEQCIFQSKFEMLLKYKNHREQRLGKGVAFRCFCHRIVKYRIY